MILSSLKIELLLVLIFFSLFLSGREIFILKQTNQNTNPHKTKQKSIIIYAVCMTTLFAVEISDKKNMDILNNSRLQC